MRPLPAALRSGRMIVLFMLVALIAVLEPRVVVVESGSVRYRALFMVGGAAHRGDYVKFKIRHDFIDRNKAVILTKRVGCEAGELLRFKNGTFYCNERALATVLTRTSWGAPLTPFAWNGPVPAGKAFVVGDHPRSFDSRYFGFVNDSELTKLWPLF